MPTVCIINHDEGMREVLTRVVRSVGLTAELYDSAEAFLQRLDKPAIGCLLVDVELSGNKGSVLLERLAGDRLDCPVVLMGGTHDALAATAAKRLGAVIIDKPFDARLLAQTIRNAVFPTRP